MILSSHDVLTDMLIKTASCSELQDYHLLPHTAQGKSDLCHQTIFLSVWPTSSP